MTGVGDRLAEALADRYRIERELGQGGMATVYLAEDLRHDRNVAIKVLKPELAAVIGAERFLTEIKTTANLQHPHILPLFDSGQADSFLYFVMPYVEGESLREKLDREKQLPVDEAVRIATEIAQALEYAHSRGVIHRDIKPANILLHEGRVLVADFGIALAVQQAGGTRLTETGLSVGTPQYMSPEQATGDRELDGRSDVYSLGCVLYEMLAGDPPHTGSTAQAIFAKVLTDEPRPLTELRATVPAHIAATVRVALQKLPADRFATARRFQRALEVDQTVAPTAAAARHQPPAGRSSRLRTMGTGAIAGLAIGVGITALAMRVDGSPQTTTTSLILSPPPGVDLIYDTAQPTIAFSPDGRRIAYVGSAGGQRLYMQDLDDLGEARPIPGTEGALSPFFSPDGLSLAFATENQLKSVSVAGGEPIELADVSGNFRGGAFSPDGGTIYYSPSLASGLWRVPADGGDPEQVTTPDGDGFDNAHWWPQVLPDGERLIYTSCCGRAHLSVLDLASGARSVLRERAFYGRYLPSGHLVYAQSGSLLAATFDPATLELGPGTIVVDDAITGLDMHAEYGVSVTGSLVYLAGPSAFERSLSRLERDGTRRRLEPADRSYNLLLDIGPDDRRVAYTLYEGQQDVYLYDLARGDAERLTTSEHNDFNPVWTRDGRRIVFTSVRSGRLELYVIPADRSGPARLFYESPHSKWANSWSPGDELLAVTEDRPGSGFDVMLYSEERSVAEPLLEGPFNEFDPAFSADGRWLAYTSDESGQREVYVIPFPGGGRRCKVSAAGGSNPRWSEDELFFKNGVGAILAVGATELPTCRPAPRELLDGVEELLWDVASAGDFFIAVDPRPEPRLRLVLDWSSELTRRLDGGER